MNRSPRHCEVGFVKAHDVFRNGVFLECLKPGISTSRGLHGQVDCARQRGNQRCRQYGQRWNSKHAKAGSPTNGQYYISTVCIAFVSCPRRSLSISVHYLKHFFRGIAFVITEVGHLGAKQGTWALPAVACF